MRKTAVQSLGSLVVPMILIAVLSGAVIGALAGAAISIHSMIEAARDPAMWNGWGPSGYGIIPVIYGVPAGGIVGLIPATGSFIALLFQIRKKPYPSVKHRALASSLGAAMSSAIAAIFLAFSAPEEMVTAVSVGFIFVALSFGLTLLVMTLFLESREAFNEPGHSRDKIMSET